MKKKITLNTYIKRNNEVFASQIDDEVVMMNIQSGKYYGMDSIGSRIWDLINEKIQVQQVVDQLLEEYEVSEEKCKNDVFEFLNELQENRLIEIS